MRVVETSKSMPAKMWQVSWSRSNERQIIPLSTEQGAVQCTTFTDPSGAVYAHIELGSPGFEQYFQELVKRGFNLEVQQIVVALRPIRGEMFIERATS